MNSLKLKKINIKYILLAAFSLRALWAILVPVDVAADSFLYDAFAKSIAHGNGYAFPNGDITVYWPVGTSAVYAVLYGLFNDSIQSVVLFNIFIGVLIVWLTYQVALQYFNPKIAQISATLVTFWPIMIEFTTILASELIFILFLLSALYIWGCKNLNIVVRTLLSAAFICFATYIRPTALPILLLLPIIDLLSGGKLKSCFLSLFIATVTAVLIFSPWVYRNQQIFSEFVLVSANGGANLWMGNNPSSNGGYTELPDKIFKNEVVRDRYYKQEAINFIKNNPVEYLKLAVKRALITYKAETIGVAWNGYLEKNYSNYTLFGLKFFSTLFWWVVLSFAGLGIFHALKDKSLELFNPLVIIAAYIFIFPILTVGQDRYHMPLNPFLAIFAAFYIYKILLHEKCGVNNFV